MNATITPKTTVADLVGFWLEHLRAERRLDRTTINEYERVLRNLVVPSLGSMGLAELTTEVVLTMAELESVRSAVRVWLNRERSGPKSSGDIADIIEVMLGTGARIGEVLALRWADIDFAAKVLDLNATTKTESGIGTYRKTLGRPRLVAFPEAAALTLQTRRRTSPDNFLDAVFPTRNVTWQQVNNVERRWRQIRREAGPEWVTPDVFRRAPSDADPQRPSLPEC